MKKLWKKLFRWTSAGERAAIIEWLKTGELTITRQAKDMQDALGTELWGTMGDSTTRVMLMTMRFVAESIENKTPHEELPVYAGLTEEEQHMYASMRKLDTTFRNALAPEPSTSLAESPAFQLRVPAVHE